MYMKLQSVFVKTEKGVDEIETRRAKLDHRLRALLLVVNGKTSVEQLMKDFDRYGDVSAMLQQLEREGLITEGSVRRDAAAFETIRADVAAEIHATFGPSGDEIAEKVEECRSVAELRTFMQNKRPIFQAALGGAKAAQFSAKIETLLR